jgi:hypothetical protein
MGNPLTGDLLPISGFARRKLRRLEIAAELQQR